MTKLTDLGAPIIGKRAASSTLQMGQRVTRKDSAERGTVVDVTGRDIKVKWDRGSTSYFRRGALGNVRLQGDSS